VEHAETRGTRKAASANSLTTKIPAARGTDRGPMLGAVVGNALGSLDYGTGVIGVLVTLQ
jgi:hypothetical protein